MKNTELIYMKFIGSDGSLGYRYGSRYLLNIRHADFFERLTGARLIVTKGLGGSMCPYQSLEAFLKNWEYEDRGDF